MHRLALLLALSATAAAAGALCGGTSATTLVGGDRAVVVSSISVDGLVAAECRVDCEATLSDALADTVGVASTAITITSVAATTARRRLTSGTTINFEVVISSTSDTSAADAFTTVSTALTDLDNQGAAENFVATLAEKASTLKGGAATQFDSVSVAAVVVPLEVTAVRLPAAALPHVRPPRPAPPRPPPPPTYPPPPPPPSTRPWSERPAAVSRRFTQCA